MFGIKLCVNYSGLKCLTVRQFSKRPTPSSTVYVTAPGKSRYVNSDTTIVTVRKKNVKQSPLKMKFLVGLIRNRWVPDALAQMKFTPKHRAVDIAKMINRACAVSKIHHECIPEELVIKEVEVTKGQARKRMTIMGRGRTGFGYTRESHVRIAVDKLDFPKLIADAKTVNERRKWTNRYDEVKKLKDQTVAGSVSA